METSIEHILSTLLKDDLMEYIETHPKSIEALLQLAILNKPPHSARAAWLLSKVANKNKRKIKVYVLQMIAVLRVVKDGQKRSLINVLRQLDLEETAEGMLYDVCVDIWIDLKKIPSARFTAFKFIVEIGTKYPELYHELILLTEDHYLESLSQGIKRITYRMINDYKKKINA